MASDWAVQTAVALREQLIEMGQRSLHDNRDGFDEEFESLRALDYKNRANRDEFFTAKLGSNMGKNRFKDVLANEGTRVVLDAINESGDGDYINANYCDARRLFGVPFTYIATQAPMKNTVFDFWRMVLENNTMFIVMLCNELEAGKKKSERYWPSNVGEQVRYGPLAIELLNENIRDDTAFRTMRLTTRGGIKRTIHHFQFIRWPDAGIPANSSGLMEIITQLGKTELVTKTPIVVHCSGGVGRTGVFITLHVALALFQMQDPISVPRIVQLLKYCRSGMVQRKDQYLFCYYAILREMERMVWAAQTQQQGTVDSMLLPGPALGPNSTLIINSIDGTVSEQEYSPRASTYGDLKTIKTGTVDKRRSAYRPSHPAQVKPQIVRSSLGSQNLWKTKQMPRKLRQEHQEMTSGADDDFAYYMSQPSALVEEQTVGELQTNISQTPLDRGAEHSTNLPTTSVLNTDEVSRNTGRIQAATHQISEPNEAEKQLHGKAQEEFKSTAPYYSGISELVKELRDTNQRQRRVNPSASSLNDSNTGTFGGKSESTRVDGIFPVNTRASSNVDVIPNYVSPHRSSRDNSVNHRASREANPLNRSLAGGGGLSLYNDPIKHLPRTSSSQPANGLRLNSSLPQSRLNINNSNNNFLSGSRSFTASAATSPLSSPRHTIVSSYGVGSGLTNTAGASRPLGLRYSGSSGRTTSTLMSSNLTRGQGSSLSVGLNNAPTRQRSSSFPVMEPLEYPRGSDQYQFGSTVLSGPAGRGSRLSPGAPRAPSQPAVARGPADDYAANPVEIVQVSPPQQFTTTSHSVQPHSSNNANTTIQNMTASLEGALLGGPSVRSGTTSRGGSVKRGDRTLL